MKYLFSILSVLVVIFAALLIVPSFIDWGQYREEIKAQVEKATGYNLALNGELRAAFLPSPKIRITNVEMDSGTSEGAFAFQGQVDEASVSLELMPLLSGQINVSDVSLIGPVVAMQESARPSSQQQQLDRITSEENSPEAGVVSTPSVSINRLYLEDAKISFTPLDGEEMNIALPKMLFKADSLQGPFNFDGRVQYQDFDVQTKGKVGAISDQEPMSVSLSIDGQAYDLSYSGIVDTAKETPELQGEMQLSASSIKSLAAQFGANDLTIKDQSLSLSGMIGGTTKKMTLENGSLTLGNAESMPVAFGFDVDNRVGRTKVQNIPGGGMLDLDIVMGQDVTRLRGQVAVESLRVLLADRLGLVEAAMFDNPSMPLRISGDVDVALGDSIRATSEDMMLGDYKLSNSELRLVTGKTPSIDLLIGNFEGAKISAKGTMDMAQGIDVSVAHPNAAQFIQVFNPEFQSSPNLEQAFTFTGKVKVDGDTIRLEGVDAKIGGIDASGLVSINNSGAIPSIVAEMQFGNLDTQALLTGKASSASASSSAQAGGGAASQSPKSGAAPWTRDAIDTSFLRAINLDLTARANRLVHGTWTIQQPQIDIDLNNGTLNVNTLSGQMFGGVFNMTGRAEARGEGQPLSVSSTMNAENVNLSELVKAATSQTKERVTGTGTFKLNLSTSGLSSSALIYALNGDGNITTSDIVVTGIDLAKVTEAISDESLTDLGQVVRSAFNSGQTPFQAIDHPITIREGVMPVNNLTLRSSTADLIANGSVNFADWRMDVTNMIDFTDPDDLPSVEMTLKGPLNAPQQNVAQDVLMSFIKNKYGGKIQKKIQEELGDSPAGAIINNLLGLPTQQRQQPAQQAPASNDNVEQPAQEQPEAPQQTPQEQLLRGLFDQIGR